MSLVIGRVVGQFENGGGSEGLGANLLLPHGDTEYLGPRLNRRTSNTTFPDLEFDMRLDFVLFSDVLLREEP
jgi:hypothetical protein